MSVFSRFNARKGNIVELKKNFYHANVLENPFSVSKVEIHKTKYNAESPASSLVDTKLAVDLTNPSSGQYQLDYDILETFEANFLYFDVWHYDATATSGTTIEANSFFKIYEDMWFSVDGLQNFKYQMYPDIKSFTSGEKRKIELEIVPLPLYCTDEDVDNMVLPITGVEVKIETTKGELIQDWTPSITENLGRKVQVYIDTTLAVYRKGVYHYYVKLLLPDSSVLIMQKFAFNIV